MSKYQKIMTAFLALILVSLGAVIGLQINIKQQVKNTNILVAQAFREKLKQVAKDLKYHPNDIVIGDINAPVTIFMYTNYNCTYCDEFFETRFQELNEEFFETGIARLIIRNQASSEDPLSLTAAKAAYCAYAEGVYLPMHRKILQNYDSLTQDSLFLWAKNLGTDSSSFVSCLDNPSLNQIILDNRKESRSLGIRGTPAFVIGDNILLGKRSLAKFRELIEEMSETCE